MPDIIISLGFTMWSAVMLIALVSFPAVLALLFKSGWWLCFYFISMPMALIVSGTMIDAAHHVHF